MTRSYKTVLRAIGRRAPPRNLRTEKRLGDLVLTRVDQPAHVVTT